MGMHSTRNNIYTAIAAGDPVATKVTMASQTSQTRLRHLVGDHMSRLGLRGQDKAAPPS